MKKCVKCGRSIETGLRCKHCRYYVDQEIRGERCRSFRFYFTYWRKCKQDRKPLQSE